ncbi:unnamed protein product [Hymenolepis diminuta]|uniref:Heparosan-N-sulfate-glucuronate 5-epimerase n=2 Tax=Hymenolepis diminuta TaxID=6216 RepID=A0A0R3SBW8_HYMDI|nr:unnamed protein product [Hymenolepis diminuta]
MLDTSHPGLRDLLEISHCNNQTLSPQILKKHSPLGDYMGQSTFSEPEGKTHVLLIDPDYNIPISRQWDSKGHPYPVQIAQYGLAYYSHFRKLQNLKGTFNEKSSTSVLDLKSHFIEQRKCVDLNKSCSFVEKTASLTYRLKYTDSKLTGLIASGVNWPKDSRLIFRASFLSSSRQIETHFACSDLFGDGSVIISNRYWALGYNELSVLKVVYFLRQCQNVTLLQNLDMVITKAVSSVKLDLRDKSFFRDLLGSEIDKQFVVNEVELVIGKEARPLGQLNELLLFIPIGDDKKSVYGDQQLTANRELARRRFLSAAEWFVKNQQDDGSWRVEAKRVFTSHIYLKPGWCSAMGQGQAISLLVRAANQTKDPRFQAAAGRALGPFSRPVNSDSSNCGVRAYFMDQITLPWFEEYPAIPSVFVLNGFIFSLIGLYDLCKVSSNVHEDGAKAAELLAEGVETLVHVLPLFDSGFGSLYDLRHLNPAHALRLSPHIDRLHVERGRVSVDNRNLQALLKGGPNRARWEYHRVHLHQLFQMANVIAPQYASTWNLFFDRWLAYMWGFRSGHN